MGRALFSFLTALSLLVFITASAAWCSSQLTRADYNFAEHDRIWNLKLRRDQLWLTIADGWSPDHLHPGNYVQFQSRRSDPNSSWGPQWLSFSWAKGVSGTAIGPGQSWIYQTPGRRWVLGCAPWLPALLSIALPIIWLTRRIPQFRQTARIRQGLCVRCGYDLRASKERCPECGETATVNPAM